MTTMTDDALTTYVGSRVAPFTKLGNRIEGATSVDEALSMAGLDWTVTKEPLFAEAKSADGESRQSLGLREFMATVKRDPDGNPIANLGVVGKDYVTHQNRETFQFLDNVAGGLYGYHDAGEIDGGKSVFVALKANEDHVIDPGGMNDRITPWLWARTNHDGNASLWAMAAMIRWACTNGLVATVGKPRQLKLQHRSSLDGKVFEGRKALGMIDQYADAMIRQATPLARTPMDTLAFEDFVAQHVVPDAKPDAPAYVHDRRDEQRAVLRRLWDAPTQANIAGTRWAAYNAVAEYLDWYRPVRDHDEDRARAMATFSGTTDKLKIAAFNELSTDLPERVLATV